MQIFKEFFSCKVTPLFFFCFCFHFTGNENILQNEKEIYIQSNLSLTL